jgi:hypothetical protein
MGEDGDRERRRAEAGAAEYGVRDEDRNHHDDQRLGLDTQAALRRIGSVIGC